MTTTAPKLRPSLKRKAPGLLVERGLRERGLEVLVGMDEVGRGAWAGPLTVGAAIVPLDRRVYKIRDSKLLTEEEREALFDRIAGWCEAWSVGHASPEECDELGMSEAQRLAGIRNPQVAHPVLYLFFGMYFLPADLNETWAAARRNAG